MDRLSSERRWLVVFGVAGTLLMAAAMSLTATVVATVSAQASDPIVIHSCVSDGSGAVRIVAPDESCKPGWTPLEWNQAGPPGPSTSTRVVSDSITVPPANESSYPVSVSVLCGDDEWLTGGGVDQIIAEPDDTPLQVLGSSPVTVGTGLGNGWTATARSRTTLAQELIVFAVCASSAP
jgi:hypothetical protein